MKKRLLSVILVLMMMLSSIPCATLFNTAAADTANVKNYTVLVLETGFNMSGDAFSALKSSAKKFCATALNSYGENYIAVVSFAGLIDVDCEFTTDYTKLKNAIDKLTGNTQLSNMSGALKEADKLLSKIPDETNVVKNVLLVAANIPNTGEKSTAGPYKKADHSKWEYANACYNTAVDIKNKGIYIYVVGLLHNIFLYKLSDSDKIFARRLYKDLASGEEYYFEVNNPSNLESVLGGTIPLKMFPDPPSPPPPPELKPYEFKYAAPSDQGADYTATCYYWDNYFSGSAKVYHPSLATASLCFELAAWGSNEDGVGPDDSLYINKSKNIKALLGETGFKDIEVNDYFTHKPEMDSMGAAAAHKDITVNGEECTLIPVFSRGGGYEAEWAGNFDMGKNGQHTGFKTASGIVYDFLTDYVQRHKSEFKPKIKLWFAGFSRGAATIDLLAARLNKELSIGGVNFAQDDFYVYCFESPMGAVLDDIRVSAAGENLDSNIHLIVNPNDVVTKVAPRYDGFGFYRVGIDAQIIPTKATSNNYAQQAAKMLAFYKELDAVKNDKNIKETVKDNINIVDTFQAKKLSFPSIVANYDKPMNVFLDDLIKAFSYGLKNRETYVNELQQAVKIACASLMSNGANDKEWQQWLKIFPETLMNNIGDLAAEYAKAAVNPLDKRTGIGALVDRIDYYAIQSLTKAGFDTNGLNGAIPTIKSLIKVIGRIFEDLFKTSGINDIITVLYNTSMLGPAHYPELCLAWLMAQDQNYGGTPQTYVNGYRVIRINCPVDVNVYDSENELVASIINDEPQDLESSIVSSFNADGEKVLYLPADGDYFIAINATGSGTLSYSVTEFNYDTCDMSKMVNYYDVPISEGDLLDAVVPQYSPQDLEDGIGEGTNTLYSLSINNKPLTPDVKKMGDDATEAVHFVNAESNNEDRGVAFGSGIRNLGSYAQVTAVANDGYSFAGWYLGKYKVSSDKEYRFRVESDVNLVAKFSPEEFSTTASRILLGDVDEDGKITVKDATRIQKHVAKMQAYLLTDLALRAADADGDGKITVKDATVIQKYVAKFDLTGKPGENVGKWFD